MHGTYTRPSRATKHPGWLCAKGSINAYTDEEVAAISQWLRDGLSSGQMAKALTKMRGTTVTRNAIIGLVSRNPGLKQVGFARKPGQHCKMKPGRGPDLIPKSRPERRYSADEVDAIARWLRDGRSKKQIAALLSKKSGEDISLKSVGAVIGLRPPLRDLFKSQQAPVPPTAECTAYDAASRHVPLWELERGDCRFAVNDAPVGESHTFCGLSAVEGTSWCRHHASRVFYRP